MDKPGTARQKLRLAKSTLGRLEKAAASGITVDPQADAKKEDANAPPSPFIKEVRKGAGGGGSSESEGSRGAPRKDPARAVLLGLGLSPQSFPGSLAACSHLWTVATSMCS